MKKTNQVKTTTPLLLILLILSFAIGCQQKVEDGLTSEEVQKIIADHLEILNEGNITLVDELFTSEYISHYGNGEKEVVSIESNKKDIADRLIRFPDAKDTIEHLIFQDNKIVIQWKFTGTDYGTKSDDPPSGVKLQVEGVLIFRIVDGKIAESWNYYDNESVLKQLGWTFTPPSVDESEE